MKRCFTLLMALSLMNLPARAENIEQKLDQISELINEKYFSECKKEKNKGKLQKNGSCGRVYTSFGRMEYDNSNEVIETQFEGRKEEIDEHKLLEAEQSSIKARIYKAYGPLSAKIDFSVDNDTKCSKNFFYKDMAGEGDIECKTKRSKKPLKENGVTKKILATLFSDDPEVLNCCYIRHNANGDFEMSHSSSLAMNVYIEDSYIKISTQIYFEKDELENAVINKLSSPSSLKIHLLAEIQRTGLSDSVILFDTNTKSLNPYYFLDASRGSVVFETFIPKKELTEKHLEVLKEYMNDLFYQK